MRATPIYPYLQALPRLWRDQRRMLAAGLASGTPDYFQVLQVSRDASATQVKSSFYQQAKRLHPDVNKQVSPQEARRRFQELADAYATLSDESLRASHEMMLDIRSKGTFSAPRQQTPRGNSRDASQDVGWDPWSTPRDGSSTDGPGVWGSPSDASRGVRRKKDSWFEAVRADFQQALAHAYQGPRFDALEVGRMYPFDFEAEERAGRGIHDHVLQVVSGRQLLGHVQEVRLPALESRGAGTSPEIPDKSTYALGDGRQMSPTRNATAPSTARVGGATARDSVARRRPLGSRTAWDRKQEKVEAKSAPGGEDSCPHAWDDQGGVGTLLELVWMGRVVAVSSARWKRLRPGQDSSSSSTSAVNSTLRDSLRDDDDFGMEEDDPDRFIDPMYGPQRDEVESLTIYGDKGFWRRSPVARGDGEEEEFIRGEGEDGAQGHRTAMEAVEAGVIAEIKGHGLKHKRRPHMSEIFGPDGELTHRMASMWTPGVHHLTWMSMMTGRVECRATRGWVPPSNMWLFDPRNQTHDIGGWYFERLRRRGTFSPRDGVGKEASALDPAVPILIAAHRTLRREEREMEVAARKQRMAERVRHMTRLGRE